VASHVKDVAPENGSTTSRHAERNDVVDALRALQSIGDMRGGSGVSLRRCSHIVTATAASRPAQSRIV
jgi:hypothetical protein